MNAVKSDEHEDTYSSDSKIFGESAIKLSSSEAQGYAYNKAQVKLRNMHTTLAKA